MQHSNRSKAEAYIEVVTRNMDHLLEVGKDRYGEEHTPLYADGFHVDTHEPVVWLSEGKRWTVSNLANQQNWFRALAGLSALSGNIVYKEKAAAAMHYGLTHLRYGDLLYWGGHLSFDLQTKQPVYAADKGPQHELKCHYPYYELMFELSSEQSVRYVNALWDSHVRNWDNLEFSRHGKPAANPAGRHVWDRDYAGEDVFFTGEGLTFINAGSDLYYAAAQLFMHTGDDKALVWAERLARRYTETRHPDTGMGGYQFSISVLRGGRGDRAIDQFAEQLSGHTVMEPTVSVARQIHTITAEAALCRMELAEKLGERGANFLQWAAEDLLAYGKWAYDKAANEFHPMLTDGTRLTGLVMEKDGYYGKRGEALQAAKADLTQLWSYAKAFRLTSDARFWQYARSMAAGNGLGDIGSRPGGKPSLVAGGCSDPAAVFALLELYEATGEDAYVDGACGVADRIAFGRFGKGVFLSEPDLAYAKLDAIEPLALLRVAETLLGRSGSVPSYCGGKAFFGAAYDGCGHAVDNSFFYRRKL